MNLYVETREFRLGNEKILKITNDNDFLRVEVNYKINSFHVKSIVRLSGDIISEKKETYSIFIHMIDGTFLQIDNMFCFLNEKDYYECYNLLSNYFAVYNLKAYT